MNTTNPFMFYLFCDIAAWDYIAQDDVVNWSRSRRWIVRQLCTFGMWLTGLFWRWKNSKCPHSTGTVLFSFWRFSITHCDYGCGETHWEWEHSDGVTRTHWTIQ